MTVVKIAKNDVVPLRGLLYEKFQSIRYCPARKAGSMRMEPELELLAKTIRKLNRAAKQAHGHDCNAGAYDLNYWAADDGM